MTNILRAKAKVIVQKTLKIFTENLKSHPQFLSKTLLLMNEGSCKALIISKDKLTSCRICFKFSCANCSDSVVREVPPKPEIIEDAWLFNSCEECFKKCHT